jgi:hypothetical protein
VIRFAVLGFVFLSFLIPGLIAQQEVASREADAAAAKPVPASDSSEAPAATPVTSSAQPAVRPRMAAAAKRNENVAIFFIDTNAIKEANIRIGATPTAVTEARVESQYFASEHGSPPSATLMLRPGGAASGWHGDAAYNHQNSAFNSRTFFQVGPVQPSRRNAANVRLSGPLPVRIGFVTGALYNRDTRGMVNGNVLVPLPEERTPLATDPAAREFIQKMIDAFPDQLPNRPDFDQRALNTNARQRVDELGGTMRLDVNTGAKSRLFLSHTVDRQRILAFQFVAGQNPNTEIHTHRSQLTWDYQLSARTLLTLGGMFHRVRSALNPEPNAVGPRVRFGSQIEELGPASQFPIDRATNSFRYGAAVAHTAGRHSLTFGADVTRFQLNGIESNNLRGYMQFQNNFGKSAIENMLLGQPTTYEVVLGNLSRGFRNWSVNGYVADQWRVNAKLQLYFGLRYNLESRPSEVNGLDTLPYSTDANNFSPRLSVAYQPGAGWTLRGMYATTFGQILPVSYQQIRNNPPHVQYVMVTDPDMLDPLGGVDLSNPAHSRHSVVMISPDLATPYSHQYNGSVEHALGGGVLRVAYIGSRTFKLLNTFTTNRAVPVEGIELASGTVNQRRPDPDYYEKWNIVNGGVAYFDAGQAAWDIPVRRGVAAGAAYTFSKAIDMGPDFSGTAANRDLLNSRNQWQYEAYKDRKSLSNFDSPHALTMYYGWDVPMPAMIPDWLRPVTSNWQVGGTHLWKKGTPYTMYIGSDSPGFGNVDGSSSDRPHILDPSILGSVSSHPDTTPLVITRERFAYIRPGETAGSVGRNTFRKARIWNWNAYVSRQFRLLQDWVGQVRVEAFNLSNTPQFDEAQHNLSNPAFGKITNTLNDGRILQAGFRLSF